MKTDLQLQWQNEHKNSQVVFCVHIGRERLSALVENAISGASMGTLIRQPSGCGEQNIARMTLPVIATMYLDKTNQWETVGLLKRNEALQHIQTGGFRERYKLFKLNSSR